MILIFFNKSLFPVQVLVFSVQATKSSLTVHSSLYWTKCANLPCSVSNSFSSSLKQICSPAQCSLFSCKEKTVKASQAHVSRFTFLYWSLLFNSVMQYIHWASLCLKVKRSLACRQVLHIPSLAHPHILKSSLPPPLVIPLVYLTPFHEFQLMTLQPKPASSLCTAGRQVKRRKLCQRRF